MTETCPPLNVPLSNSAAASRMRGAPLIAENVAGAALCTVHQPAHAGIDLGGCEVCVRPAEQFEGDFLRRDNVGGPGTAGFARGFVRGFVRMQDDLFGDQAALGNNQLRHGTGAALGGAQAVGGWRARDAAENAPA